MSNSRRDSGPTERPGVAIRLVDVLRVLPERELESLIARLKIRTDEAKRIDVPSQVARMRRSCNRSAPRKRRSRAGRQDKPPDTIRQSRSCWRCRRIRHRRTAGTGR